MIINQKGCRCAAARAARRRRTWQKTKEQNMAAVEVAEAEAGIGAAEEGIVKAQEKLDKQKEALSASQKRRRDAFVAPKEDGPEDGAAAAGKSGLLAVHRQLPEPKLEHRN